MRDTRQPRLVDFRDAGSAGGCGYRWPHDSRYRLATTYHPDAPQGVTRCSICDRFVLRGRAAVDWIRWMAAIKP